MSMPVEVFGSVEAAGDLDGDRRADVLEVHSVALDAKRRAWTAAARDARSGRVLWRRSLVLDGQHGAYVLATSVGRPARPGALLVRQAYTTSRSGTQQTTTLALSFEGLDGWGRTAWRRTVQGTATEDLTSQDVELRDYPWSMDLGRLRAGTEDLVLTRASSGPSGSEARFERLGLALGDLARPYPALAGPAGDDLLAQVLELATESRGTPLLRVVPDQSGDRRDDVALLRSGGRSLIRVYRGDSGAPVWSSPPLPPGIVTGVEDAGVLSQLETRVHDLAVVLVGAGVRIPGVVTGESDRTTGLVVLLQGGTGAVSWLLPGTGVHTMRRYRGTPAIGLVSTDTGFPPVLEPAGRTLQIDVVDARGLPLATNRYSLVQSLAVCEGGWVVVGNGDDLDGDGSPEAQVDFQQYNELEWADSYVTVDGGSGALRDRSEAFLVGGSVDGHQPDRAHLSTGEGVLDVAVVQGEDVRRTVLRTSLPFTGKVRGGGEVVAVAATSSRCQDVAAASYTSDAVTIRLLASNGRTWWTLRATARDPLGTLVRGSGARPTC